MSALPSPQEIEQRLIARQLPPYNSHGTRVSSYHYVKLTADERGLKCASCHRVYPIRDDIPVMIIDEAAVEPGRPVKA